MNPLQPWRGRALLLDLFGTVVQFQPRVPPRERGDRRWRSAMEWLREPAAEELPGVRFDDVLAALLAVSEELVRARAPEYLEVPSAERFRRALQRLGIDAADARRAATRLSAVHMAHLAASVVVPPGHLELLRDLSARYALALVSNFDHAPTAHGILVQHALARWFRAILISEEFGRRKPHPSIFIAALTALGVSAGDAVFVGDSFHDDVLGAAAAGVRAVWINATGDPPPPVGPAVETIAAFAELRAWCAERG